MFPEAGDAKSIDFSDEGKLRHCHMKNISFSEKNFFYIIGNELIEANH